MSIEEMENHVIWNSDTDYALKLCKLGNQLVGIWPFECQSFLSKIRMIVATSLTVTLLMHCITELTGGCVETHDTVEILGIIGLCVLSAMKIVVLRTNWVKMKLVITSVAVDWSNEKNPKALTIMRSYALFGRIFGICEMLGSSVLVIVLGVISLDIGDNEKIPTNSSFYDFSIGTPVILSTVKTRNLPVGTGCLVSDIPSSLYIMYYILQPIQLFVTTVVNVGNDAFFLCLTLHICGQFQVLKERVEIFGEKQDILSCRIELGKIVRRYNHLMNIANYIEDIFSPIIFAILAVYSVALCLEGVQALICFNDSDISRFIEIAVRINFLLLQLYIYSYAGEHLSSQNKKIGDAAYNCQWCDLPSSIVKDIIMIIMKSNSEYKLTAGKVFQMNYVNFKIIVKTLFSYFSMMRIIFDT